MPPADRQIDSAHVTRGGREALVPTTVVAPSLLVRQIEHEELAAHLDRRHVDELGERAVRHRDPLLARRAVAVGDNRLLLCKLERRDFPRFCIDLDAVDMDERMRVDHLPVGRIEQVEAFFAQCGNYHWLQATMASRP
jgi:hypothetical protein